MNSAQWLWLMIGMQLILFSVGWWTSARKAVDARDAMQRVALFNGGMGMGCALLGLRGMLPYLLTHPLSNILSLASLIMLWSAGESLTGRAMRSREQLTVFVIGALAIAWFGTSSLDAQQRVSSYFLATAWIATRGGWAAFDGLRREGRRSAAWSMLACAASMAVMFAWRVASGLTSGEQIEFSHPSGTNNGMALATMVAMFTVNSAFAAVIFSRITAELQRQSRRDSLTGLPNRRDILERLDIEWERHKRSGAPLSVACLDVDHFKAVNDSHGHAAGDQVLIAVARHLGARLRPGDHLGRTGGEEFVVLLCGCNPEQALTAAERLRLAVCDAPALGPDKNLRLTISIGVATVRSTDRNTDDLLARADAALYQAKADGRNAVRLAQ